MLTTLMSTAPAKPDIKLHQTSNCEVLLVAASTFNHS